MEQSTFKERLLKMAGQQTNPEILPGELKADGIDYDFSDQFETNLMRHIDILRSGVYKELDLLRSVNLIFTRVAITGIAAVLVLALIIVLSNDSATVDTLLGMGDAVDETILSVLAGY